MRDVRGLSQGVESTPSKHTFASLNTPGVSALTLDNEQNDFRFMICL